MRDKIKSMFVGAVIGDLLGMPVESYPYQKIQEIYPGGIKGYVTPINHKYYDKISITDDSQLTIAVMNSFIERKDFDLDNQASHHVKAFLESTTGWGTSSREAVRRLANGVNYYLSGVTAPDEHIGLGNGITMKIAPIAAWSLKADWNGLNQDIIDFGAMTHNTKNACQAGLIHNYVLKGLLNNKKDKLSWNKDCIDWAVSVIEWENDSEECGYVVDRLKDYSPTIEDVFYKLIQVFENKIPWEEVRQEFGYGSCPAHNSLPFTYAYFFKSPTIQGLYDVINAGGDTDTNGSMFGAMLGAWKGMNIWTPELLNRPEVSDMIELADKFCDAISS